MPKVAKLAIVLLASVGIVGCQLADDPEPPRCEKGYHPELNVCTLDDTTQLRVTIASCAVTPETLTVKAGENFQFENKDNVEREVKGLADGQTWMKVGPGQLSAWTSISKVGTWAYTVSGCPKGGTLVVQ